MKAEAWGFAAWAALVVLQPAWYLWLAPPANGNAALALALTLPPLLLPLLALARGRRRALLWIGIVSLAYFCHGVVAAWSHAAVRTPALLEVAICVVLIVALAAITRTPRSPARRTGGHD